MGARARRHASAPVGLLTRRTVRSRARARSRCRRAGRRTLTRQERTLQRRVTRRRTSPLWAPCVVRRCWRCRGARLLSICACGWSVVASCSLFVDCNVARCVFVCMCICMSLCVSVCALQCVGPFVVLIARVLFKNNNNFSSLRPPQRTVRRAACATRSSADTAHDDARGTGALCVSC